MSLQYVLHCVRDTRKQFGLLAKADLHTTPSYTQQLAFQVLVLAINYTKLRSIKKL